MGITEETPGFKDMWYMKMQKEITEFEILVKYPSWNIHYVSRKTVLIPWSDYREVMAQSNLRIRDLRLEVELWDKKNDQRDAESEKFMKAKKMFQNKYFIVSNMTEQSRKTGEKSTGFIKKKMLNQLLNQDGLHYVLKTLTWYEF